MSERSCDAQLRPAGTVATWRPQASKNCGDFEVAGLRPTPGTPFPSWALLALAPAGARRGRFVLCLTFCACVVTRSCRFEKTDRCDCVVLHALFKRHEGYIRKLRWRAFRDCQVGRELLSNLKLQKYSLLVLSLRYPYDILLESCCFS